MKKYIIFIVIFFITIFIYLNNKKTEEVFYYMENTINEDYTFKDYYLFFNNLNTNNFIDIFSFFKNKNCEYKIIEIIPYYNSLYENLFKDKRFLYYSNDLNKILNSFSNDYMNVYISNSIEVNINQINIKEVIINTSKVYMDEFLKRNNKVRYLNDLYEEYI